MQHMHRDTNKRFYAVINGALCASTDAALLSGRDAMTSLPA